MHMNLYTLYMYILRHNILTDAARSDGYMYMWYP